MVERSSLYGSLSLFFALSGMLLEYATDCHKWGEDDEAYTGMALATKMFDKHENMVHGDRNGMLSHQQTLPRFWEAEMAICARAGEKDKTLACFDKVVHNDFKSGSRSVWTQLAQLHNSNGEMHVARRGGPLSNKCLPPRRTLLSRDTKQSCRTARHTVRHAGKHQMLNLIVAPSISLSTCLLWTCFSEEGLEGSQGRRVFKLDVLHLHTVFKMMLLVIYLNV